MILAAFLAFIPAVITWKVAHNFISRREKYVNSKFKIFAIKFGWSFTAWGVSLFILGTLFGG